MSGRRGGIPGPESRTGLVRPAMTEAEFERRQGGAGSSAATEPDDEPADNAPETPAPRSAATTTAQTQSSSSSSSSSRGRGSRGRAAAKPRRVQRMFAIEEELDKKLWLYAIHVGKDRSEVVNDLLRPLVASMVLYDSRDRRSGRNSDPEPEGQGGAAD